MTDLAILGLLNEQPLHGYDLKKRLRDLLGPLARASYGSLYPALARLEAAGAVQVTGDEGGSPPVPPTGSLGGEAAAFRAAQRRPARSRRGRRVYAITPAGEERLRQLLEQPGEDDRSFALKMAFLRLIAAEARLALLERRRAALQERLAEGRRALESRRPHDPYARSLLEHDVETTERDIAWLDRLLAGERASLAPANPVTGGSS